MPQLPFYKSGEREMGAPQGFQPPKPLTQANNGGPMGLGQPARTMMQAAPSPSRPAGGMRPGPPPGPPPPGSGQPPNIYPPTPANPAADLWSSRNSREPLELILQAYLQFQGRMPQAAEVQHLLMSPNNDVLVEQLLNLRNPGQMSPVQSAILQQ